MPEGPLVASPELPELEQAIAQLNSGDAAGALPVLERIVAERPDCARALCGRGSALRDLGRIDEAVRDYEAALAIEPRYARALFNRGLAQLDQGHPELAFVDLAAAIEIDPESAFFFHRGRAFAKQEKHAQAVEDFTRCLACGTAKAETHFERGTAYASLKNHSAAVEDFRAAVKINPDRSLHHSWLAFQLALLGKKEHAVAALDEAIARELKEGELFYRRGGLL